MQFQSRILVFNKINFRRKTNQIFVQAYGPPAGGESLEEARMREVIALFLKLLSEYFSLVPKTYSHS